MVQSLSSRGLEVFVTTRSTASADKDSTYPSNVTLIENVDLTSEGGGSDALELGLRKEKEIPKFDLVIYSAGLLKPDVSHFKLDYPKPSLNTISFMIILVFRV